MGFRSVAVLLLGLVFTVFVTAEDDSDYEVLTETEYELKRMLRFVTPLMAIVRKDHRVKRSSVLSRAVATKSDSYGYGGGGHESYGYGGGGHESSYYYEPSCCDEKTDYLSLLSFISLGLLGLFLVALLSTTSTRSGRRKRSDDEAGNDVDEEDYDQSMSLSYSYTFLILFRSPTGVGLKSMFGSTDALAAAWI